MRIISTTRTRVFEGIKWTLLRTLFSNKAIHIQTYNQVEPIELRATFCKPEDFKLGPAHI